MTTNPSDLKERALNDQVVQNHESGADPLCIELAERISQLEQLLGRVLDHPNVDLCDCGEPTCLTQQIREALGRK